MRPSVAKSEVHMFQRERIADGVYSFQSDIYAQVNAGAVIGPDWVVVIDTLALPEESIAIRNFIEQEINLPIRYVINTHSHADHAWGNCFFPGATIASHYLCRQYLDTKGRDSLEAIRKTNLSYKNAQIVLPQITFAQGEFKLQVGKKTLKLFPLPGPCSDNIGILVEEDRVLFAGDAVMPIPYIVDGDYEETIETLKQISKMGLENIVQGHGDIVLRGEVELFAKENIDYLIKLKRIVRTSARRKYPRDILDIADIEDCGKSRVLIGGLAPELHHNNLLALYQQIYGEPARAVEDDDYYEV
jgi:glyoxylase-like metal-dependent hydrolase (beta-lactamase superfamily II)